MFDPKKKKLGDISLLAVNLVESSEDEACAPGCGFELEAHVRKKGDAAGMRRFVLQVIINLLSE